MLGVPRGMIFSSTMWLAQIWSKSAGYSNAVVGSLGCLGIASLIKLPFLNYISNLNLHGFMATRHRLSGLLVCAVMIYCSGLGCAAYLTPKHFVGFVASVLVSNIMASIIELVLELLRMEASKARSVSVPKDTVAADFGVGDRVGSVLSKPVFLMVVGALSWPCGVSFIIGVVVLCTLGVFILDQHIGTEKHVRYVQKSGSNTSRMKAAVRHILDRYGWSALLFPLGVILNDSFARPMIGVMLVDIKTPIWVISVGYTFLYAGGVFGAMSTARFLPTWGYLQRLLASVFFNALTNASMGLCAVFSHKGFIWSLMFFSGLSQGLFLQFFRLSLEHMCVPRYAFLQMGLFLTVWILGAPIAGVSGVLVDFFGSWVIYFVSTCLATIPAFFVIMRIIRKDHKMSLHSR